jgi:hypothetical protein
LIDLGSSISFDEEELNMIRNLVTTLEPVKLAVDRFVVVTQHYCQLTQRSRL